MGFTGYMATRPDTLSSIVETIRTDIHLILTSLFVIAIGLAMVWYRQDE